MLVENRSLLELIDADYTFVNRDLAEHYDLLDKVKLRGFGQMRQVELPAESDRGGVITMAASLAVSSYPHRSSPVLRGKWLLDSLFDVTLPPPPPNIPSLDDSSETSAAQAHSLREKLEQHRADASCAACHDRLDPLGFALENYDAIGRWRQVEGDQAINVEGVLANGQVFSGPDGLKQVLMERKDQFLRGFIARMLGYALGRGLVNEDFYTVELILHRRESSGGVSTQLSECVSEWVIEKVNELVGE